MAENKEIKAKVDALSKYLNLLDNNKLDVAKSVINKLAFLDYSLEELQKMILSEGYIEEYQNGANQYGKKPSSAATVYTQYLTGYNKTVKTFIDLFNTTDKKAVSADLAINSFMAQAKAVRR